MFYKLVNKMSKFLPSKRFFSLVVKSSLIVIFILAANSVFLKADKYPDFLPIIDKQLSQTINYIFQEDYIRADSICVSIIAEYPDHPAGYFMKGILHWRKGYFLNNYNKYNDITLEWLKKSLKIAKSNIKDNPDDPVAYFFAGGAYGYQGSVFARRKSWIKTGRAAYNGIRSLEKSMKLDSSLYDVYYGSGLYHVLASHQPGVIKWIQKLLPIPAGDSDLGINHLQIAIEKGKFTNLAAQSALALAYVSYENKYNDAVDLLIPLIEQYPQNLDFLTTIINAYFYRELTDPTTEWEPLRESLNQTRKAVIDQNLDFQQWWRTKFDFMEGYMDYMAGDLVNAKKILTKYVQTYPKKGGSYLSGLGYLTLGKIADLQGSRELAIIYYKKVAKLEDIGNEKKLAKKFIKSPFIGEDSEIPFTGHYVDLPDRP